MQKIFQIFVVKLSKHQLPYVASSTVHAMLILWDQVHAFKSRLFLFIATISSKMTDTIKAEYRKKYKRITERIKNRITERIKNRITDEFSRITECQNNIN